MRRANVPVMLRLATFYFAMLLSVVYLVHFSFAFAEPGHWNETLSTHIHHGQTDGCPHGGSATVLGDGEDGSDSRNRCLIPRYFDTQIFLPLAPAAVPDPPPRVG